ncbi:hypothetical protein LTR94_031887, partial [Friedmanniomyces endolithicus]
SRARPMPRRAACTASAYRWSMRCRRIPSWRSRASGNCIASGSRAGSRRGRWRMSARRPTAAAPRSASFPIPGFSDPSCISSRHGATSWHDPRRICSRASRSAGNARRSWSRERTRRRRRCSSFPAGWPITCASRWAGANAPPPISFPAIRTSRPSRDGSNGR